MTPKPKKWRHCRPFSGDVFYKPQAVPLKALEVVDLGHDELEAMRLCDHDGLDQQEAAEKMKVSRGTIQRLLYTCRKKLMDALFNSKAMRVVGGEHIVPGPAGGRGQRGRCRRGWKFEN